MKESLIVAMDRNRGIGYNGEMPWERIRWDLDNFRDRTFDRAVVMGRETYESIERKLGGPLPNRDNIVLSRTQNNYHRRGRPRQFFTASSIEQARMLAIGLGHHEMFFIGGQEVYEQAIRTVSRMMITQINEEFVCDRHFPSWNDKEWVGFEMFMAAGERTPYDLKYLELERYIY